MGKYNSKIKRYENIILNILKKQSRVHYTYIARVLEISPTYARDIVRGMAEFYPFLSYEHGYIVMASKPEEKPLNTSEVEAKLRELAIAKPVE